MTYFLAGLITGLIIGLISGIIISFYGELALYKEINEKVDNERENYEDEVIEIGLN